MRINTINKQNNINTAFGMSMDSKTRKVLEEKGFSKESLDWAEDFPGAFLNVWLDTDGNVNKSFSEPFGPSGNIIVKSEQDICELSNQK